VFFRALYLALQLTPALLAARQRAAAACEVPSAPYAPHASLLYGWHDAGAKATELAALSAAAPEVLARPFRVDRLELHRTIGPLERWTRLGEWRLQGAG
jgi:hypothetical protein